VKKLRKQMLLSLQTDDDDKKAKKDFKKVIQQLEVEKKVNLGSDGTLSWNGTTDGVKDEVDKSSSKKEKKRKKANQEDADDGETDKSPKKGKTDSIDQDTTNDDKNKACKGNPNGITRLFLGNLPFAVDDTSLQDFMNPAVITHIKWITDKETGKFYGSAFIEMKNSVDAAIAVTERNDCLLMNRKIRINYAPSRPGDIWPPKTKEMTGNSGQAGGAGIKAMSAKPDNCMKLFIGNLSYEIDDDGIAKFFSSVDAEIKAVRWLHHKDSGDFKGCGYVEFWNTDACEKAATLNGKPLLGRPIRIDWTD
jgi:RNA recognition motif-containing protein